MYKKPKHFQEFKTAVASVKLPGKFTFPFYYDAHPLAKIATDEVQTYLLNQKNFKHNFGLNDESLGDAIGKMFGVLIVKNPANKIGYLAAFSGKLQDKSLPDFFVPPVFNMRKEGSFYIKGEKEIDAINLRISTIINDKKYHKLSSDLNKLKESIAEDLAKQRKKLNTEKSLRKEKKKIGLQKLDKKKFDELSEKLKQESYNQQFFYKELTAYYQQKLEIIENKLSTYKKSLETLKIERKEKSNYLQQTLFSKYSFLNKEKKTRNLLGIFNDPDIQPPAGSGECAAPKLLQYAFQHNLEPICMAEFWWGVSPNTAIRKHKNFYPSCQSRCKPILTHMLQGIETDANLLLKNLASKKSLKIIFEDDALLVINKPTEFLTVPGKTVKDAVYTRIKEQYPEATGPLIVHRLDMSTSGLLVVTKTKEANKEVQRQFINKTVQKRYVALLDGVLPKKNGTIKLPLRVDLNDRPRQLVDFIHGKNAETKWNVIAVEDQKTRVHFYPITGRTHQLRVHAAHKDGLNTPITGDDLYGKKADRLHLHAEYISFLHPTTKEKMRFKVDADF